MKVQMQRSFHLNDEDQTEVDKENTAQGSIFLFLVTIFLLLFSLAPQGVVCTTLRTAGNDIRDHLKFCFSYIKFKQIN